MKKKVVVESHNKRLYFNLNEFRRKLTTSLDVHYFRGPLVRQNEDFPNPCNISDFAAQHLVGCLFSKYDDGLKNKAKDDKTWSRFYEAETSCHQANQRIRKFRSSYDQSDMPQIIWSATRKIQQILGLFRWRHAVEGFGHGSGGTTRLPKRKADAAYKFSGLPDSTPGNARLAALCISQSPLWKESVLSDKAPVDRLYRLVPGNSISTVPKNYKTHRTIAKEPCMNIYVQRGLGSYIRRRLMVAGIDLNNGQVLHQNLALSSSLTGELATIDLSLASDSVSTELVRLLLPPDWFDALEQCRSPLGKLPSGSMLRYEKFSSMGNGYTFELETLIFYALTEAVRDLINEKDRRVSVYGDDIICPVSCVTKLIEVFKFCGFKTNESKSFWSGDFRESCGLHAFRGHDVTPFYIKGPVETLGDLFLVHNQLHRWLTRVGPCLRPTQFYRVHRLLKWIRSHASAHWYESYYPDGYGDGRFINLSPVPELLPDGCEGFTVKVLKTESSVLDEWHIGLLVKKLSSACGSSYGWNRRSRDKSVCEYVWVDVVGAGLALPARYRVDKARYYCPPIANAIVSVL